MHFPPIAIFILAFFLSIKQLYALDEKQVYFVELGTHHEVIITKARAKFLAAETDNLLKIQAHHGDKALKYVIIRRLSHLIESGEQAYNPNVIFDYYKDLLNKWPGKKLKDILESINDMEKAYAKFRFLYKAKNFPTVNYDLEITAASEFLLHSFNYHLSKQNWDEALFILCLFVALKDVNYASQICNYTELFENNLTLNSYEKSAKTSWDKLNEKKRTICQVLSRVPSKTSHIDEIEWKNRSINIETLASLAKFLPGLQSRPSVTEKMDAEENEGELNYGDENSKLTMEIDWDQDISQLSTFLYAYLYENRRFDPALIKTINDNVQMRAKKQSEKDDFNKWLIDTAYYLQILFSEWPKVANSYNQDKCLAQLVIVAFGMLQDSLTVASESQLELSSQLINMLSADNHAYTSIIEAAVVRALQKNNTKLIPKVVHLFPGKINFTRVFQLALRHAKTEYLLHLLEHHSSDITFDEATLKQIPAWILMSDKAQHLKWIFKKLKLGKIDYPPHYLARYLSEAILNNDSDIDLSRGIEDSDKNNHWPIHYAAESGNHVYVNNMLYKNQDFMRKIYEYYPKEMLDILKLAMDNQHSEVVEIILPFYNGFFNKEKFQIFLSNIMIKSLTLFSGCSVYAENQKACYNDFKIHPDAAKVEKILEIFRRYKFSFKMKKSDYLTILGLMAIGAEIALHFIPDSQLQALNQNRLTFAIARGLSMSNDNVFSSRLIKIWNDYSTNKPLQSRELISAAIINNDHTSFETLLPFTANAPKITNTMFTPFHYLGITGSSDMLEEMWKTGSPIEATPKERDDLCRIGVIKNQDDYRSPIQFAEQFWQTEIPKELFMKPKENPLMLPEEDRQNCETLTQCLGEAYKWTLSTSEFKLGLERTLDILQKDHPKILEQYK